MTSSAVSRPRRAGFTLIEMLVVLAIIAILAGMLMPLYAIMRDAAMKSKTSSIMKKVDTCLRMFRTDFGTYPYQTALPDLAGGETFAAKPNNLFYRLGMTISDADLAKVKADMATAAGRYDYNVQPTNAGAEGVIGAPGLTYVSSMSPVNNIPVATLLNRMAREQMRLAVVSGNLAMRGPVVCNYDGTLFSNRTGTTILPTPAQTGTRLGWASDYFAGDIERSAVKDDSLIDAWKRPLVYICQVIPGVRGMGMYGTRGLDNSQFGLGQMGFDPTTGPGPSIISGPRPRLLNYGRIRLSQATSGDGKPTPTDATYMPDVTNLMGSDIRYYAAGGYEAEFELWSTGRDGKFGYMRNAAANLDNIAVTPYNKAIRNE